MSALRLSAALSRNPMTEPLLSGAVVPQGVDWTVSGVHPSEMFWRQLKFGDFDVSEMSLSSLTIAASQGRVDWVPLPVFTTRKFFHTGIVVRADAGIDAPKDLIGRRVGVPEYQQTAAVWTRAALQHEFDVAPDQMTWVMERPPNRSHGGTTAFTPPPGVELSYLSTSSDIGNELRTGGLDAAIVYIADNNLVDRTRTGADALTGVRGLFADPVAEGVRYYRKTGILPVNHVLVVRAELLAEQPWLALNLYSAFLEAKRVAHEPLRGLLEPWQQIGAVPRDSVGALRDVDPLPYGLEAQAGVLDLLGDTLLEQGLITSPVDIPGLFARSTRDL